MLYKELYYKKPNEFWRIRTNSVELVEIWRIPTNSDELVELLRIPTNSDEFWRILTTPHAPQRPRYGPSKVHLRRI